MTPRSLQIQQQLPGGAARLRVHAGGRLVEEEQAWLADQRQGQRQPSLLPAGELAAARARGVFQSNEREQPRRVFGVGEETGVEVQHFGGRRLG